MSEQVTRREFARRLCAHMGLPDWIVDATTTYEHWPGYWDELVDAETGDRQGGMLQWVRRNPDKPHRCPSCHRVVTWDREEYGPRTRLSCSRCGVQWRSGVRVYPWPVRALRRR